MCDICQEVCPFNKDRGAGENVGAGGSGLGVGEDAGAHVGARGLGLGVGGIHGASPTTEPAFQARQVTVSSSLSDLAKMCEEEFRVAFKDSPVKRAKYTGLKRNVLAALQSPAPSP